MKKFTTVSGFDDYYKASEVDAKIAELEANLKHTKIQRDKWVESYTKQIEHVEALKAKNEQLKAELQKQAGSAR